MVFMRITRKLNNRFNPQIVEKKFFSFSQGIRDGATNSQDLKVLTKHLKQALSDPKWLDLIPTVIISNQFARYAVIPWDVDVVIESEQKALMEHCFNLIYGEHAKAWDLRMNIPDYGKSSLASGIHKSLLTILHDEFSEAGMQISAVSPQLVLAINQTLSQLKAQRKKPNFWLVAIQGGHVCLTLLVDGHWRAVKNVAIEADVSAQIQALIQREIVNSNVNDELPVMLYWTETHGSKLIKFGNQKIIKLLPHQFDIQDTQASNIAPDWLLV